MGREPPRVFINDVELIRDLESGAHPDERRICLMATKEFESDIG